MLFLELAAQAVRGFSPAIRVALKPGYQALQCPTESPAPLAGLIAALVFPDGRGSDAAFLAPGAQSGRAGLTLQSKDGSTWRIVRDLGGAGGLHKLNKATNQFEVVSQDALEMSQTLRAEVGFPARTTWEQLFTFTGAQLPTRRPKGPVKAPVAMGAKPTSRMPNAQWNMEGAPSAQVEDPSRLASLEAELATANRAADIQFRLDGVSGELFEVESKTKTWDEVAKRVSVVRAQLEAAVDHAAALPKDIIARAQRLPDERKRFEEQIVRLENERQAMIDNAPVPPEPLIRNSRFWAGLVAGLGLFVGALFLEEGLRSLALLSMVPFTFSALVALRFIEDLQRLGRTGGKTEVLGLREKKLNEEFEQTSLVVEQAFAQVGVSTGEEFLAAFTRREGLQEQLRDLELEHASVQADPQYTSFAQKIARLKGEQESCNQELLGMSGGYVRDARDIERDIARIKVPLPSSPVEAKVSIQEEVTTAAAPAQLWDDPCPHLFVLAADLFHTDILTLWQQLRERSLQYLGALTERRYQEMSVDKDGRATLQGSSGSLSAKELAGKDLDLMYLALRLSLIEKAGQYKIPVVVEDSLSAILDAPRQALFGRMLSHLGSFSQVLHVSGAGPSATLVGQPVAV